MNAPVTRFLASVRDLREVRIAVRHAADVIDLKQPENGALGALAPAAIRRIVAALRGRHVVSATIGDRPLQAGEICRAVAATAATGVDIVKVGWFGRTLDQAVLEVLQRAAARGVALVVVLFAEDGNPSDKLPAFAAAGVRGAMLDTRDKSSGRLRDKMSDPELARFVGRARANGLLCGLAGSLRLDDILPLRRLQPDFLGFRGALCRSSRRTATLDEAAVESVRSLMNADIDAQLPVERGACARTSEGGIHHGTMA